MENLLRLKDRVEIALELGESHYREFKSALEGLPESKKSRDLKDIFADIAKTLVAFTNADGGELFVGIEDDGSVSGIPLREEKIKMLLNNAENHIMPTTHPIPIKRKSIIDYQDKKIVYFSVDKATKHVHQTAKGHCFQRKDRESLPTAVENIILKKDEVASREYDKQFENFASVTDLNVSLVDRVAKEITQQNISPEKFLQHMELAEFDGERLRLRTAALLLFAKKTNKWHPRSQVRILNVNGTEEKTAPDYNVTEVADIDGNIFKLFEESWEALRPALSETRYSEDGLFKTQIIYPELAVKEALINAITHRDYSIEGRGIEIRIFADRLEILSPGKLLSKYTIEDLKELKGAHETRNTYIARVLREFGYIRELGEGMRRMFELMKNNELVEPQIDSPNKSFIVTLFYKFIYTKEEKLWLSHFEHLNLSREQKTVVKLGINGLLISPKAIFDNVGIVDTDAYRELINSLQRLNILVSKVSRNTAQYQAKQRNAQVKTIPRFQITLPNSTHSPQLTPVQSYDESDYAKLFVGNVDYHATAQDLQQLFSQFGEVVDVHIHKDRYTGKSRGSAVMEFENQTSLQNAFATQQPLYLNGRKLNLRKYSP